MLQQDLKQQRSEAEVAHLHIQASQWFEAHNLLDEAIDHALLANDIDRATKVMDVSVADLIMRQGEFRPCPTLAQTDTSGEASRLSHDFNRGRL